MKINIFYINLKLEIKYIQKLLKKIVKVMEREYARTLKYRVDFLPENNDQTLQC